MPAPSITEQQVLEALRNVPTSRWGEVLAFLRSLQASETEPGTRLPIRTAADLAQSSLVGLWSDRADITDSQAFARGLRAQAEQRA